MAKYGDGLNVEFTRAVKNGTVKEPFCVQDLKSFAASKGWIVSDNYLNVALANGSSENHSLTYKKLFVSIGNGEYVLSDSAKKE